MTDPESGTSIPVPVLLPGVLPVIVTLPAPVAEMLAVEYSQTPLEFTPVPHEVPLIVSKPELVVTSVYCKRMPAAISVPLAEVPMIVTFPAPAAKIIPR